MWICMPSFGSGGRMHAWSSGKPLLISQAPRGSGYGAFGSAIIILPPVPPVPLPPMPALPAVMPPMPALPLLSMPAPPDVDGLLPSSILDGTLLEPLEPPDPVEAVLLVLFIMVLPGPLVLLSSPFEPHAHTASASPIADRFTLLFFIATSPRNSPLMHVQSDRPRDPSTTRGLPGAY